MAARGPLPTKRARRTNAPTIPTTSLPASGRKGRAPKPPTDYIFGKAGVAWWKWAWSQPQAVAWDSGSLYAIARRASLEDDLAVLEEFAEGVDVLVDLLAGADREAIRNVKYALGRLKSLAAGGLAIKKEMRELDKRLGLDPKALAELRWTIVDDRSTVAPGARSTAPAKLPANVRRIRAVDPAIGASTGTGA